jgi:hypothetical protein
MNGGVRDAFLRADGPNLLADRCNRRGNRSVPSSLGGSYCGQKLARRYDRGGIIWNVQQGCAHVLIGEARNRVPHNGDLVAQIDRRAHGCLYASIRQEPYNDELPYTVLSQQ